MKYCNFWPAFSKTNRIPQILFVFFPVIGISPAGFILRATSTISGCDWGGQGKDLYQRLLCDPNKLTTQPYQEQGLNRNPSLSCLHNAWKHCPEGWEAAWQILWFSSFHLFSSSVRSPYVDTEVTEVGHNLNTTWKTHDKKTWPLLRMLSSVS